MTLKYSVVFCLAIVWCVVEDLSAQDMDMAHKMIQKVLGGHKEQEKTQNKDIWSKAYEGGLKKGKEMWDKGQHKKMEEDSGKAGKQHHGNQHKYADEHMKKEGEDKHGDKWAVAQGGEKKDDFVEWKDDQKWNKDKGNGLVKKWNWDKENGYKNAQGKKGTSDDHHYKHAHGDKHAMKKYHDEKAKKSGKKHDMSEKSWKDYDKKHHDSGDKYHGNKHWEEKKPHYYKYQKMLKYSAHKEDGKGHQGHDLHGFEQEHDDHED